MKKAGLLLASLLCFATGAKAQTEIGERALWASIATEKVGGSSVMTGDYKTHCNRILVSWRMLPGDNENTGFDLYRKRGSAKESKVNSKPITATCFQESASLSMTSDITYRLTYTGSDETLATFTITKERLTNRLPYISIPLKSTEDVCAESNIKYQANDCSVGDLDGDGVMEIIVKRLLTVYNADGTVLSDGTGGGDSDPRARHCVIWDAYKLDSTFLWRVKSGPNIILGNSSNFGVADLDGDGCAEVVTKTGEGTVFGDGYEIPDTDNDGMTDYRSIWPAGHYTGDGPKGYGGPEFFSVIDGKTGRELARANFIARGKEGETPAQLAQNWYSNDWEWDPRSDKYQWKLANSLRLGIASFDGKKNQIFLGRGVYGKTKVEGWDYADGQLTRLWHFDTSDAGGADKNKDGKPNSAYAGQGNHSFTVADLDGDGKDEVMYGSCAWDDDGTGLWTTGLGHGDAQHVGKFLPQREGLQVFHCLENGKTMVALHDARDGSVIWKKDGSSDNDMGRCLVGDFYAGADFPGCEFYYYQGNIIKSDGTETTYSTKGIKGGCAMAIWFDGSLLRQQMEDNIINSISAGRTFTMWPYGMSSINGTKGNPSWYGDLVGDWREEVIMPDATKLSEIKIFSTWYPTTHKFPWLMTDHQYYMSCVNQNVGYNQPNNLSYYLGADLKNDREAWEAAGYDTSGIQTVTTDHSAADDYYYTLSGQRMTTRPSHGVYIYKGRKYVSHY